MDKSRDLSDDSLSSQQRTADWQFASADSAEMPSTVPQQASSAAADRDAHPAHIGRYVVETLLGNGSFGRVYRCHDGVLKRSVAVKVPHPHLVDNADLYLEEAQVLASLEHPAIVPVYDAGRTEDGLCYVVSKYIEGNTLAKRMKDHPLSHAEVAELVATVAEALHHAHLHHVVHRDIKPANILMDSQGKPYVADFGLALTDDKWGQGGSGGGTLAYMSPEQARGEGHLVDGRSDEFSLGVVFYELLTGSRPFRARDWRDLLEHIKTLEIRPPRQLDDSIPKELERICLKALSKRASDRYTTTLDMAEDLRCWLRAPPTHGRPAARVPHAPGSAAKTREDAAEPLPAGDPTCSAAPAGVLAGYPLKRLFISYAGEDQGKATQLCSHLERQGIGCWIAPRDVSPGDNYAESIIRAIEATSTTVLLLSARANASVHVAHEVEHATSMRKRVIPVRLEDVQPGPSLALHLGALQWLDAWIMPIEQAASQVAQIVRALTVTTWSEQRPGKVVPKGLRSFDAQDADFFLELLAGARDRDGLPASIRFWKYRIEETDPEQTFRVGLIYGPSGCGKSSLIKAGLLPRLASSVIPVYIEATADDTEHRLLRGLRSRCPQLSTDLGLRESIAALRRGRGLPPGKKVLVVLDQFEQWLHSRQPYADAELVEALRHCDGERVQCVVMVRDDFWMAVTRFLRELEVHLVEGQNSAAVDLFDVEHARKVLAAFGGAFGKLPDSPGGLSKEQTAFLQQATAELAEDGKVICVRLALFADMMKGKPWTLAALKAVGGIAGVGVTFLEETFSAATAPPEHRLHQRAARAVLRTLMPDSGAAIKGEMRSYADLLDASGYKDQPRAFDELVRILDTEVRLITPTDPEGGAEDHAVPATVPSGKKCYQLTHDYLVPSLREWLTRKQKETRRGRAELLLEERTREWAGTHRDRFLPSFRESLVIALFTRRKSRAPAGQAMLRRAFWVHGRRLALGAAMLAAFALSVWTVVSIHRPPQDVLADVTLPAQKRLQALTLLDLDSEKALGQVLEVGQKDSDPQFVGGMLKQLLERATGSAGEKWPGRDPVLNASEALLGDPLRPAEVRAAALAAVKALAGPHRTLVDLREVDLRDETDGQLVLDILRYIESVNPSGLPENDRPTAVRDLVEVMRAHKNPRLVEASCKQLDKQPVDRLIAWLVESCRRDPEVDLNTAAAESIGVYIAECGAGNRQRTDEIGGALQRRLAAIVAAGAPEHVRDPFELEWLVQAMGLTQAQSASSFHDGLKSVSNLLWHWELGDASMLKTVIDAYVVLRLRGAPPQGPDARRELAVLRGILRASDDPRLTFAPRVAAAKALSRLQPAESLPDLIEVAGNADEFPNVRIAALKGVAEIGSEMRVQHKDTRQIGDLLKSLLQPRSGLPGKQAVSVKIVDGALEAFAKAGDAKNAALLFPWTLDPALCVQGTMATSYVIYRSAADAPVVLRLFAEWLVKQNVPDNFTPRPGEAVTNMAAYCPGLILTDRERAAVRRAVMDELDTLRRSHPDERVRRRAAEWAEALRRVQGSDAGADAPARDAAGLAAGVRSSPTSTCS